MRAPGRRLRTRRALPTGACALAARATDWRLRTRFPRRPRPAPGPAVRACAATDPPRGRAALTVGSAWAGRSAGAGGCGARPQCPSLPGPPAAPRAGTVTAESAQNGPVLVPTRYRVAFQRKDTKLHASRAAEAEEGTLTSSCAGTAVRPAPAPGAAGPGLGSREPNRGDGAAVQEGPVLKPLTANGQPQGPAVKTRRQHFPHL